MSHTFFMCAVCAMLNVTFQTVLAAPCSAKVVVANQPGDLAFGLIEPPPGRYDMLGTTPGAIAVDSKGNIYVGDQVKYRVLKFDSNGKFLLKIPLRPPAKRKDFPWPSYTIYAMAFDINHKLYVLNDKQFRVEVYRPDGTFERLISYEKDKILRLHNGRYAARYHRAERLRIDVNGNIYIFDNDGGGGGVYTKSGQLLKRNGREGFAHSNWTGFAGTYSLTDELLVTNAEGRTLNKCTIDEISIATAANGQWVHAIDSQGAVYVLDSETLGVLKISP